MPAALDNLKHIVVLMMENRSFDHMLGYLKAQIPAIDGLTGAESNPDTTGVHATVQPRAEYQSQLDPDPGHHFEDVHLQIFGDVPGGPMMQGFIKSYYQKQQNVEHSRQIMYAFPPEKLPILTTLARKYAVFNAWFSSLPGPTIPNRAFAHFGTSFGKVDNSIFYIGAKYPAIYSRMLTAGRTSKVYYYDEQSSTISLAFLLKDQPKLFGTFEDFQDDCKNDRLPDYSFLEPNYSDHDVDDGEAVASDQHPDHNVMAGEGFIKEVYEAIRNNPVWESTALLIVYDEHGGIYDHVTPPACTPDEFQDAGTGFQFDRLGVRVPAVLVSPWVPEGTIVPGHRVFDHASIPATVTEHFIGSWDARSPREKSANTFLDILSLGAARNDVANFDAASAAPPKMLAAKPGMIPTLRAEAASVKAVMNSAPVPGAANPQRPLSKDSLLWDHVLHLHDVEMTLPREKQTQVYLGSIRTEADAGAYIEKVTRLLRAWGSKHPPRILQPKGRQPKTSKPRPKTTRRKK